MTRVAISAWMALAALVVVCQWSSDAGKDIVAFAAGAVAVFVGFAAIMTTGYAVSAVLDKKEGGT